MLICILYQYHNKTGVSLYLGDNCVAQCMAGPLSLDLILFSSCPRSVYPDLSRMIEIRLSILLCFLVPGDSVLVCDTGNGLPQPHPEDCSAFYQCSGAEKHQFFCPTGLVFNPDKSFCDWPSNVKCTDSALPTGSRSFVLTRFVGQNFLLFVLIFQPSFFFNNNDSNNFYNNCSLNN